MSPFAHYLRELRSRRGLRQKELAEQLGYEQSYLSALELGTKGPPRRDFLERLTKGLNLSAGESAALHLAVERSRRSIKVPMAASEAVYELCHALGQQLEQLEPFQIELISLALRMNGQRDQDMVNPRRSSSRPEGRPHCYQEESTM